VGRRDRLRLACWGPCRTSTTRCSVRTDRTRGGRPQCSTSWCAGTWRLRACWCTSWTPRGGGAAWSPYPSIGLRMAQGALCLSSPWVPRYTTSCGSRPRHRYWPVTALRGSILSWDRWRSTPSSWTWRAWSAQWYTGSTVWRTLRWCLLEQYPARARHPPSAVPRECRSVHGSTRRLTGHLMAIWRSRLRSEPSCRSSWYSRYRGCCSSSGRSA